MSVHYVPITVLDTKRDGGKAEEPMSSRNLIQRQPATCNLNMNKVLERNVMKYSLILSPKFEVLLWKWDTL